MSNQTQTNLTAEWSHKIDVGALPDGPFEKTITADETQRRDLARRIGVKSVEDAVADVTVTRAAGTRTWHVTGRVRANVIQSCVVTMADIRQMIDEPFDAWFADKDAAISLTRARHDKMSQYLDAEVPMLDEEDDPEPVVNNQIDLGEVAAQFMSLGVNPYPHAAGVNPEVTEKMLEDEGVAEQSRNPFAALKKWKAVRGHSDKK